MLCHDCASHLVVCIGMVPYLTVVFNV